VPEPEQVAAPTVPRIHSAGEVAPRRRSAQKKRFARRADERHATAADRHGVHERMRVVDRVDLRVDENQVRRGGRLALGVGSIGATDYEERSRGETSHDIHFR
jgi:hypothetical protein